MQLTTPVINWPQSATGFIRQRLCTAPALRSCYMEDFCVVLLRDCVPCVRY